jgi:cyclic beta-1,2-glucan glucanotransferase
MHDDPHFDESSASYANESPIEAPVRVFSGAATPIPAVQLLSNGRYHAIITNAGGGYSRWKDIAVTRWREDSTRDNWGTFCYLRDVGNGAVWSTTYQPTLNPSAAVESSHGDLIFFNGLGGFTPDGHEYVVTIAPGQVTPAPWVNVLANPSWDCGSRRTSCMSNLASLHTGRRSR